MYLFYYIEVDVTTDHECLYDNGKCYIKEESCGNCIKKFNVLVWRMKFKEVNNI
jgi:hypothetical protein